MLGFLGTVRGRGGIAFDRFLVYGTGGVAFGSNTWPNTAVATVGGIPGFFTTNTGNNGRVGYAVGAGVEYAYTMVHGAPPSKFPEYVIPVPVGAH